MKKLFLLLALTTLAGAARATLVFDNYSNFKNGVSGAGLGTTTSTPNSFMGDGYRLLTGTTSITGFDFFPYNGTGTNLTNLRINVFVWGGVNTGTVNATTPAFSNLLGSYTITYSGNFTTGFYYPFESTTAPGVNPRVNLPSALAVPSTIGLTFNYQGSTDGTTFSSINNLTSEISYGTPASVGSNVFDGYYRNGNSETNGNFTSGVRSFGQTNQSVAVRVYGNVQATPEPSALAAIGVGAVALLRRRKRA